MKALAIFLVLSAVTVVRAAAPGKGCGSVEWRGTRVEARSSEFETELVAKSGDAMSRVELPMAGPGHLCQELKVFVEHGIVMARHRTGALGTSALHQKEMLSFFRVIGGRLEHRADVTILHTEQTAGEMLVLSKNKYEVLVTKAGLTVELRDSKTGVAHSRSIR